MQCDFCDNESNIELTIFIEGQAKTIRICSSCYEKKLEEFTKSLPDGWNAQLLAKQVKEVIEQAEKDGVMPESIELTIQDAELTEDMMKKYFAEGGGQSIREFMEKAIRKTMEQKNQEEGRGFSNSSSSGRGAHVENAREISFQNHLKRLRFRRRELMENMERALREEDYETCAQLREELTQVAEQLVTLNEERNKPDGV